MHRREADLAAARFSIREANVHKAMLLTANDSSTKTIQSAPRALEGVYNVKSGYGFPNESE